MPRQLRVEYEGAIYHLMNRGDRWEPIFLTDEDRELFVQTLGEVCQKTGWQVHAYCLMGNHFHLVVETPRANSLREHTRLRTNKNTPNTQSTQPEEHLVAGKTNINYIGTQVLPLTVAKALLDGTSSYARTTRNGLGQPTQEISIDDARW